MVDIPVLINRMTEDEKQDVLEYLLTDRLCWFQGEQKKQRKDSFGYKIFAASAEKYAAFLHFIERI